MKQQESGVPMVVVIGGVILAVISPFVIKAKDYFSQKFNEISTAVHNFTNSVDTHGITAVLLCLLGLLVIYFIYRIIRDIKNKIKSKKEETKNLKQEAEEIEKILDTKLDFDSKELILFIDKIESKIKVSMEFKKLSIYRESLKEKLKIAKAFLECIDYEGYVNSLSQKETDASNNLKRIKEETAKLEQNLSKGKQQIQDNCEEDTEENSEKPQTENGFIDVHKGFFKHSNLSLNDIKYLIDQGYQAYSSNSIMSNKEELYLIKPGYNESQQHFFLVCDIVEYIRKFTKEVETFNTKKPDIVFEVNNRKIAIEVETGTVIKDKKKFLEKVKILNETYPESWFFVLTNKKLFRDYSNYGKTCTKYAIANKLARLFNNSRGSQKLRT